MNKILVLISFLILSATNGFAWGEKGHSLVAEVAFRNIDATTKKNVLKYLNGMSFKEASIWMDNMRSEKSYDYMKPYHYVNFEKDADVKELDGENIINTLNKSLKDFDNIKGLSNDEIRTRLLYIFHLIGDLHQPLHVGYKNDKGGNTVQVSLFGRGSNLHKLWDSDIIEYKGLTIDEVLKMNNYNPNELVEVKYIDIIDWAKDSRKYLNSVYSLKEAKVNEFYIDNNYKIIKQQILKAGLRLASILDYYFKDANNGETAKSIDIDSSISINLDDVTDEIEAPVTIDVNKAKDYEGKVVNICAKVYGTKVVSNGMVLLNLGADYPNSPLTIAIYADDLVNFDFKPEDYYKGKAICVIGKVKMYKERPEIIVKTQNSIQVK